MLGVPRGGGGVKNNFLKHGHVAYEIDGDDEQIKDRKHIEHNFHSVAWIVPHGWDLGVLGSKTVAWEFAMAPHRLRVPVYKYFN